MAIGRSPQALYEKFLDMFNATGRVKTDTEITASIHITETDYQISDVDDDASPNYYGYVDSAGAWYIMKETVSAGANTYRYCKGASGYSTAWTNRATQTYDTFDAIF